MKAHACTYLAYLSLSVTSTLLQYRRHGNIKIKSELISTITGIILTMIYYKLHDLTKTATFVCTSIYLLLGNRKRDRSIYGYKLYFIEIVHHCLSSMLLIAWVNEAHSIPCFLSLTFWSLACFAAYINLRVLRYFEQVRNESDIIDVRPSHKMEEEMHD